MTTNEEKLLPYDFADWQIGETDLPADRPALVDAIRAQLRFAFTSFGQGQWIADPNTGRLTWRPDSEIFGDPPPPVFINMEPTQLIPLLTGDLASDLSVPPEFDVETQEYADDKWWDRWAARMNTIKAWKNAILQCEKAMKNMKTERQILELHEKER
jgi:hypothetical protein